jgi:hypothetical protein
MQVATRVSLISGPEDLAHSSCQKVHELAYSETVQTSASKASILMPSNRSATDPLDLEIEKNLMRGRHREALHVVLEVHLVGLSGSVV